MTRVAEGFGWLVYAVLAVAVMVLPDRLGEAFLDGVAGVGRRAAGGGR